MMQEFEEDYYAVLGVEESATADEIRRAYLQLAKKLHPDRYPNDPEQRAQAQSEFAKVTRAHDIVSDSQRRAEYDTLRALAKKRDEREAEMESAAANGSSSSQSAGGSAGAWMAVQSRSAQAQTSVEDETINVKWANKHLSRADDLFRKRKYQEAETAMKEAIRLVPQEPKYHNKLAEIYLARGWRTLAMTEVQSSLRIDPKDAEAKSLEAKIRALVRTTAQTQVKVKKGFLEQLKSIFSGKKG
ncbi:MAG TPA: DnaJ domain-containing protein [Chroococcales cyanobacterium]